MIEERAELLGSVYPYFKQVLLSKDGPEKVTETSLEPIARPICADLFCFYAVDGDLGYEIVQARHLRELKITEQELHTAALENFKTLLSTDLTIEGDSDGYMFTLNGNLEAGLVLVDEFWQDLESDIGEEVVVAVPSRDVVVATGRSNRAQIDRFSSAARGILEEGDHPVSKNWFLRTGGQWEVFEPILGE